MAVFSVFFFYFPLVSVDLLAAKGAVDAPGILAVLRDVAQAAVADHVAAGVQAHRLVSSVADLAHFKSGLDAAGTSLSMNDDVRGSSRNTITNL